jgi:Zn-dependent protease with chaperone function
MATRHLRAKISALLAIFLLMAPAAPASAAADASAIAALDVTLDMDGKLSLAFTGPPSLAPAAILEALAFAFRCEPGDFVTRGLAAATPIRIDAACAHTMRRNEDLFEDSWDLYGLAAPLRAAAVGRLNFSLAHPQLEVSQLRPRMSTWRRAGTEVHRAYWRIDDRLGPGVVTLTYGFENRSILYRYAILPVLFYVLVIAIVAIVARRARGKPDPVAAWSAFQSLASIAVSAGFLVWMPLLWTDLPSGLWLALSAAGDIRYLLVPLLLLLPVAIGEITLRQIALSVARRFGRWPLSRRRMLVRSLFTLLYLGAFLVLLLFPLNRLHGLSSTAQIVGALVAVVAILGATFLRPRLLGIRLYPLADGEFRQRVHALASRYGVRIGRIGVLTGSPADVPANAWVKRGQAVTYTAQLLQQMSRSEVDAVTLAEIGRLKLKHVKIITLLGLLSLAGVAVVTLLNGALLVAAFPAIVLLLVAIRCGFLRRLCLARDRWCARMGDDPASLISALTRLAQLNGQPLALPAWQIWLATHPSMMVRFRAIAAATVGAADGGSHCPRQGGAPRRLYHRLGTATREQAHASARHETRLSAGLRRRRCPCSGPGERA